LRGDLDLGLERKANLEVYQALVDRFSLIVGDPILSALRSGDADCFESREGIRLEMGTIAI